MPVTGQGETGDLRSRKIDSSAFDDDWMLGALRVSGAGSRVAWLAYGKPDYDGCSAGSSRLPLPALCLPSIWFPDGRRNDRELKQQAWPFAASRSNMYIPDVHNG